MANTPAFAATPVVAAVSTGTTASTTPFGPTPSAPATVYTAPASGARIDEIDIVGLGTTSNNLIVIHVYNGTTYWPIKVIQTTATTVSATVAPFTTSVTFSNLVLTNASYSIRVSLFGADTAGYMITVLGGSF
jgi:hypothetical protein